MTESGKNLFRSNLLIAAGVQFLLLTGVAMWAYPGGYPSNHYAAHYSFTMNFFSDLGTTATFSGQSNLTSMILFVIALTCVGMALVAFSLNYRILTAPGAGVSGLGKASVVVATVSGLSFIGIACTPLDHAGYLHLRFVEAAFGFLLVYMVMLVIMQMANGWPGGYIFVTVVYLFILLGYVVVFIVLPRFGSSLPREANVLGQKVVVYSSIIALGIQAYGIRKAALEMLVAPALLAA